METGGPSPRIDPTKTLRRDLDRATGELRELRSLLLRIVVGVTVAIIGLGLLLPLWREDDQTARVLTAGFQALGDDGAGDAAPYFAVGFIGLLVTIAVVAWALVAQIANGQAKEDSWYRTTALTLAIIGTLIAMLLSAVAAASDEIDTAGGWGGVVLLGGLCLATWIIRSRTWREIWVQEEPATRSSPSWSSTRTPTR